CCGCSCAGACSCCSCAGACSCCSIGCSDGAAWPDALICCEQDGQAPQPWLSRTFSATAICSSRLASAALPEPPCACQVCGLNCKPPSYPLPVLMLQSPPDSHSASWSHVESGTAFAGAAKPKSGTEIAAAAIRVLVASLPRDGLVMAWRASCFKLSQSFPSQSLR